MSSFILPHVCFSLKDSLESGQVFNYVECGTNTWKVYKINGMFTVEAENDDIVIEYPSLGEIQPDDFENFFDVDSNYKDIILSLVKRDKVFYRIVAYLMAVDSFKHIHILKQSPWEACINSILLQHTDLRTAHMFVLKLVMFLGNNTHFPTYEELKDVNEKFYKILGFGFRSEYMRDLCRKWPNLVGSLIKAKRTDTLVRLLMSITGIGPKTAEYIALYGYNKLDAFPVDAYVQETYLRLYGINGIANIMEDAKHRFGDYAGIAQQYIKAYGVLNTQFQPVKI